MKSRIMMSSKRGYEMPLDEAILATGHAAAVCYMKEDFDTIIQEPETKTIARAKGTIVSGHHSVAEHVRYTFVLEGIPKILIMVLNNMGFYSVSEKSARYTKMAASEEELVMYEKWIHIIKERARIRYGDRYHSYYRKLIIKNAEKDGKQLSETEINQKTEQAVDNALQKIGQENGRYFISVFTPATVAVRSVDLRQLNYELYWMHRFIKEAEDNPFNKKLKAVFEEYIEMMKCYVIEGLDTGNRIADITLFDKRNSRKEQWGETYSANYMASCSSFAQAHRHRTLRYTFKFLETMQYYIPKEISDDEELVNEYLKDMSSVSHLFPQGMLVMVNERGTYEDFMRKCEERLCGCAQLETALQTKKTMERYLKETKDTDPEVYEQLFKYSSGARCTFAGWKCKNPCIWGAKDALSRLV